MTDAAILDDRFSPAVASDVRPLAVNTGAPSSADGVAAQRNRNPRPRRAREATPDQRGGVATAGDYQLVADGDGSWPDSDDIVGDDAQPMDTRRPAGSPWATVMNVSLPVLAHRGRARRRRRAPDDLPLAGPSRLGRAWTATTIHHSRHALPRRACSNWTTTHLSRRGCGRGAFDGGLAITSDLARSDRASGRPVATTGAGSDSGVDVGDGAGSEASAHLPANAGVLTVRTQAFPCRSRPRDPDARTLGVRILPSDSPKRTGKVLLEISLFVSFVPSWRPRFVLLSRCLRPSTGAQDAEQRRGAWPPRESRQ